MNKQIAKQITIDEEKLEFLVRLSATLSHRRKSKTCTIPEAIRMMIETLMEMEKTGNLQEACVFLEKKGRI